MGQCVEILMPDGGEVLTLYAAVGAFGILLAAIDNDAVSPLNQTCGKFFGEGLKAAITGRDSPRAKDRDSQ